MTWQYNSDFCFALIIFNERTFVDKNYLISSKTYFVGTKCVSVNNSNFKQLQVFLYNLFSIFTSQQRYDFLDNYAFPKKISPESLFSSRNFY